MSFLEKISLFRDRPTSPVIMNGEYSQASNYLALAAPITPFPTTIVRVRILSDWYECDYSKGKILTIGKDETEDLDIAEEIYLYDSLGIIKFELAAIESDDGLLYIPSGYYAYVWLPIDAKERGDDRSACWEPLSFGESCISSSESKSSSESSSEESGSSSGSGSESEESASGCVEVPNEFIVPSYKPGTKQVLGHDTDGCLIWIDVGVC